MPLGKEWKPERCCESPPSTPATSTWRLRLSGGTGDSLLAGEPPALRRALVPRQDARRAPCFTLQPQPRGQERSGPRREVQVRPDRRQLTSSLRRCQLLAHHMATSGKVRTLAAFSLSPFPWRCSGNGSACTRALRTTIALTPPAPPNLSAPREPRLSFSCSLPGPERGSGLCVSSAPQLRAENTEPGKHPPAQPHPALLL